MKRTLIAFALSIFAATTANAGSLDSAATSGWDTKQSDSNRYKLEAYGFHLRVYEWRPKGNSNVTCVIAFSEKGPIGLQCFENEEKNRKK